MILKRVTVGQLDTNAYIIGDESKGTAIIVDPGDSADRIMEVVRQNDLRVESIIFTHAHFDHIGAAGDIKKETGADIYLHSDDLETYDLARDQAAFWGYEVKDLPKPDKHLDEGDEVRVGKLSFRVLHTPGHSRGGICLLGEGVLITGDTIFAGSVGRTDFPGGSIAELKKSFKRIVELPEDTLIYPGHGPDSSVKKERLANFFMNEI
ncbi:MAG: MBL fold metallo-hydrolase [Nitrospira sp.]|nr:MBL fold metallo-hydrolase [bacterium]MBL7048822.1 MBL fold metallo-hydrolase [Nitrospira sp.]